MKYPRVGPVLWLLLVALVYPFDSRGDFQSSFDRFQRLPVARVTEGLSVYQGTCSYRYRPQDAHRSFLFLDRATPAIIEAGFVTRGVGFERAVWNHEWVAWALGKSGVSRFYEGANFDSFSVFLIDPKTGERAHRIEFRGGERGLVSLYTYLGSVPLRIDPRADDHPVVISPGEVFATCEYATRSWPAFPDREVYAPSTIGDSLPAGECVDSDPSAAANIETKLRGAGEFVHVLRRPLRIRMDNGKVYGKDYRLEVSFRASSAEFQTVSRRAYEQLLAKGLRFSQEVAQRRCP
jgi:hypothetical protein